VSEEPLSKTRPWRANLGWKRVDSAEVRVGYPRPREFFKPLQKEIERQKVEILEREEKRKKTEELRESDREYSQKLSNGNPEEQQQELVYQEEVKKNGWANDHMEGRRSGLA